MMTLDISPEALGNTSGLPFMMQSESKDDQGESIVISRSETGEILGTAYQQPNPRHVVRFFQGKGGFCAVIYHQDIVYFALPGSRVSVQGTTVDLPGDFIGARQLSKPLRHLKDVNPQQVTDQAMILGAGMATRFEPVSGDTTGYPKPGVPLVGEDSVIVAIAKHLRRHGFKRILVNTFYKPQSLKEQLGLIEGLDVVFIDEAAPSGTAGGLAKALEQGLVDTQKSMFIIQGDAVTDADLSLLVRAHQERRAAVTIGGQIVADQDVDKFGIIETDASGGDQQSGHITSFKEKPSLTEAGNSRFANSGFYILSPAVYPLFLKGWESKKQRQTLYDYAQDFFPTVLSAVNQNTLGDPESGKSLCFWAQVVPGYWSDIGNPAQYIETARDVYAGDVALELPTNLSDFYNEDILYWPGTKALAHQEKAKLEGNIIVARRYSG